METNRTRNLIIIGLLLLAVIYIVIPNSPGIHIPAPISIDKDFPTALGLDLRGGLRVLLEVDLPAETTVTTQQIQDAKSILENRVNALGVSEVTIETAGNRRLVAELPGVTNTEDAIAQFKQTGLLAFVPLGSNNLPEGTKIKVDSTNLVLPAQADGAPVSQPTSAAPGPQAPTGPTATPGGPTAEPTVAAANPLTAGKEVATYRALMTGTALKTSAVTRSQTGKVIINFTLNDQYSKIFGDYTSTHVGQFMAIVLDGVIISNPSINGAITDGAGIIEGNFTVDSANVLVTQLRYGSLPVPFRIAETRQVGATLGQDSVNRSMVAGLIGLLLVIIFMVVYYRLPGAIAAIALLIYAATTFAIFKLIPVTLTLPGIAGFVLSIGVAVDANILIFSRLKEELRAGRPLLQAIDLAWGRAWPSIRDSNISTLITCAILFIFGSAFGASLVKGFAVTLALGVFVSLFTAIFVTRTILHLVLDGLKFTEHPRWFMAEPPMSSAAQPANNPRLDIIGKRYLYIFVSLAVIVPGLIALILWGLPLAIDFSGGSMLEVGFSATAPQPGELVQLYTDMGVPGSQVQSSTGNLLIVRSKEIDEATKTKIIAEMQKRFGETVTVNRFDSVGPTVSKEVGTSAAVAVGASALGILIFITFAFRGVPHAFRYGTAAIIAMLHDVAVVIGIAAILGHFLHWEIDSLFLTALLTIIGFSVHDTIVVFDRIRENSNIYRRLPFTTIVNHSIVQTMDRSINTQLTVMMTLMALALFGGVTVRSFVVTLLIGVFSGTYSSIFNAAPILVIWENREWRTWFRRSPAPEAEQKV